MAHFSVTPETAIYMCPPYSLSQENDKNKTNRTSLYNSSAGGTFSIFGELRFNILFGAAIKKKKKKTQQTNCQIALILRVYLASIFFSSGGGFCLQDLTIEEKKPHTQLCIVRCGTKVGSQHTVGFQFLILFDPIV